MNKVITINDWCDGPLIGLAYYETKVVIYNRLFDGNKDEWTDKYKLTFIGLDDYSLIMAEWERWVLAVNTNQVRFFTSENEIFTVLQKKMDCDSFVKKGDFYGKIEKGWISTDYWVNWK